LLERAAEARIEQLSLPGSDPDELADMLELELPRQIAVTAAIRAARMMFEQGDRMDAYRLIKKTDTKFPLHHERIAAGDLLYEVGASLAADKSSFLGMFKMTDDAQEVLEYLILYYPWAAECDRAYATLAAIYEDEEEWELAIERHEKLVLNHPGSDLRVTSQAAVPRLRLASLRSPEYDRGEMLHAKSELEEWLRSYPGHEFENHVRLLLSDCMRRLSDNDLIVARFYRTVDNEYGARRHAERALEEARAAQDEERARAAEEFVASLPPPPPPAEVSEETTP
jgi:tetratricopeptide (TPR) repeat protein